MIKEKNMMFFLIKFIRLYSIFKGFCRKGCWLASWLRGSFFTLPSLRTEWLYKRDGKVKLMDSVKHPLGGGS